MPIITDAGRAEIAAGAGQLPVSPEAAAAPAVDANPGYRDAMIAALPAHAAAKGIPAERYEAWRAERVAELDVQTGWKAPDPLIAAEHARAEAHAIAIDATPESYHVEWPATFIEGAKDLGQTTTELRTMAAALALPSSMGKTLLEHLAQLAPRFRGMSEDAASAYKLQAENALRATFGSQEAADAKVAEARAALGIAKDNKLAAALGQSLQILDPMVIAILAGHGQRYALFQKGRKP